MKKLFGLFLVILPIILLTGCGSKNNNIDKITWSEIKLSSKIPKPKILTGEIETNRRDLTIIEIKNIKTKEFENYVQTCIDAGYNIDIENENWDSVYGAFDKDGYSIRISYLENDKEMSITLKIPKTSNMKEIEWPTVGIGSILPIPKSNLGYIYRNQSNSFDVELGNTPITDYNEYVKSCENLGFINNYTKENDYYKATNSNGYELLLRYLGANVIEISLEAPEETENNEQTNTTTPNNSTEIRKDFKDAMDSYEKFMDEYITFMEKYKNSNGTDLSLLTDYTQYLQKYTDMVSSFQKWGSENLNTEETKYYLEVQTRVSKKLIDASIQ